MVSEYFCLLFWGESKIKFMLDSLKLFTNSNNPSRDPLQRACYGIQKAAYIRYMTVKIVPKVEPTMACTLENVD
jgi:hypothetical protein